MAREMTFEIAAEQFAELVLNGMSQSDAYKKTHPDCHQSGNPLHVKACTFAHLPRVVAAMDRKREEMRERHLRFRDSLVNHLCDEIEQCWHDNRTLAPVMKQVDTATRVLGMDKQVVDVTAKVGPIDSDSAVDKLNFLASKAKAPKGNGKK